MPTAERYARYRADQTTIWVSKTAATFLARERESAGEGAAAVLDRLLAELRRLRRGARTGAASTRKAAAGSRTGAKPAAKAAAATKALPRRAPVARAGEPTARRSRRSA